SISACIVLSTNGFFPKKIEKVLSPRTDVIVAISLHGIAHIHDNFVQKRGAFEKAVESIRVATGQGKSVQIYTTLTLDTASDLGELCDFLSQMPISEHRLNLMKLRSDVNSGYQILHAARLFL
ncbi:MAG: hypothetical protein WAV13_13805, partial [Thermodesulfovibrionales bacterium]